MTTPDETPTIPEQSQTVPVQTQAQITEDARYASELDAMRRSHEASGKPLPEQFKTVEDMYKSYRELQSAYTKSRQELSQRSKEPAPVDNPEEPVAAPVEPVEAPVEAPELEGELRIGKEEKPAEEIVEAVAEQPRVTQEVLQKWRAELASTGALGSETLDEVKKMTGFDDSVVDEFVAAQRAIMRDAYNKAAKVVQGGPDKLQKVISWAQETLSVDDARQVDAGLQGPSWEVVLLGLEAKYDRAQANKPQNQEPSNQGGDIPMPKGPITGFATRQEFYAAQDDPRYRTDQAYRDEITLRASRTNFNAIPAR